jgi:hypothetical protein
MRAFVAGRRLLVLPDSPTDIGFRAFVAPRPP